MEKKEYEYKVSFDDCGDDIVCALCDVMNIIDDIGDTETGEEFKQELLAIEDEIEKISSKIYRKANRRVLSEREEREERELRLAVSNGFLDD